jgi:hypothetical protein
MNKTEQDDEDFEILPPQPIFSQDAYTPSELDQILLSQFIKKFDQPETYLKVNKAEFVSKSGYYIFEKNENKSIYLFLTVYAENLPQTLQKISAFKKNLPPDALLLIPIAEEVREHFLLLAMKLGADNAFQIYYYDSRDAFSGTLSSLAASFFRSATPSVQQICQGFWPNSSFTRYYLWEQGLLDFKNCGPWVCWNAIKIATGIQDKPPEDINSFRLQLHEDYNSKLYDLKPQPQKAPVVLLTLTEEASGKLECTTS